MYRQYLPEFARDRPFHEQSPSDDRRIQRLRRRLESLRKRLTLFGAARVLMSYRGRRGTIHFDDFEMWTEDGKICNSDVKAFDRVLRIHFSKLLQIRNPEWERGLGGSGEFSWDLSINRLRHTHDTNVLEFYSTNYEGL
jgi:hypothetical protein